MSFSELIIVPASLLWIAPIILLLTWTAFKWPHRDHPILRLSNLCLLNILLASCVTLKGFEAAIRIKKCIFVTVGKYCLISSFFSFFPPQTCRTSNLISFQDSHLKGSKVQSIYEYVPPMGTKIIFVAVLQSKWEILRMTFQLCREGQKNSRSHHIAPCKLGT